MPIVKVGFRNYLYGKTLWEILGNLKNNGVGRIVYRNSYRRYSEPSYFKILKVAALNEPEPIVYRDVAFPEDRRVVVLVQKTFRGKTFDNPVEIYPSTNKPDFRLLPKDQEEEFCRACESAPERIMPSHTDFPPMLKRYIMRKQKLAGEPVNENIKMKIQYNKTEESHRYRVAKEGDTPNVEFSPLGKILHPHLYNLEK